MPRETGAQLFQKHGVKSDFGAHWSMRSIYFCSCSEDRSIRFVVLLGGKVLISTKKQPSNMQRLKWGGRGQIIQEQPLLVEFSSSASSGNEKVSLWNN